MTGQISVPHVDGLHNINTSISTSTIRALSLDLSVHTRAEPLLLTRLTPSSTARQPSTKKQDPDRPDPLTILYVLIFDFHCLDGAVGKVKKTAFETNRVCHNQSSSPLDHPILILSVVPEISKTRTRTHLASTHALLTRVDEC